MTHRESRASFKRVYNHVFGGTSSLSKVKDAVLTDRLFDYSEDSLEVPGRSIAWKLFLIIDEPLKTSSTELNPELLLNSLRSSRKRYAELLSQKMKAPDGSYAEGFVTPGSLSNASLHKETRPVDLERNNPLSLHNDNPWTEWFAALELRRTILQDVERTFPEIDFFRHSEVQDQLANVLFLYSSMNPDIGYRQGMHELLAPLYYAVDVDSFPDSAHSDTLTEICSRSWIAADAWVLFESVMRYASRWYEWRERPSTQSLPSPLSTHVQINPDGQAQLKPYIAPIVQDCNQIQSAFLRSADPLLWKHLQSNGIEPQIYGIRWLRLLFTREFSMPDAMRLWDALFACDPTLDVVPWVCVVMLLRIRNVLIPSDYSAQLTVLLRYPTPAPTDLTTTHQASLLVRQALALQSSPTPATGVSLVVENRNLLDIPMEVPAPEPPPAPRRRGSQHSNKPSIGHTRQQSSQHGGFPEMIARGLFERGESLNINKTLFNAVTELRRNIPELASFVRSPLQSPAIPMTDERQPDERPPWEPKSRRELEREMGQLRMNNKRLGESLGWVVDILLRDDETSQDAQKLKQHKQEALESLSYVRDVLINGFTEIEDDRLYGEEELAKRKQEAHIQAQPDAVDKRSHPLEMPKPAPVPVVDSHIKPSGSRISSDVTSSPLPLPHPTPSSVYPPPWSPNTARLAPWNHSRSNFSTDLSSLPATSLPRLPPPTSKQPPTSGAFQRNPSSGQHRDSAPPAKLSPKRERTPDPLGVLK